MDVDYGGRLFFNFPRFRKRLDLREISLHFLGRSAPDCVM
jgi:hypothetical protein